MPDEPPPPVDSGAARHPRAVAMLVCDRIIRDARTGRVTLVDLLEEALAATLPLIIPSVSIYVRMTDVAGFYAFTLDVVRRDDLLEVVRAWVADVEASDPLEDVEVTVQQLHLQLPSEGFYDVPLWANGRFLHSVSLQVLR